MHRELFHVGSLTVYSYGVMLALAFIAGGLVARRRFKELYRDPYIIVDLVLAALIGGIVGARLFYVVGHWGEFSRDPGKIFTFHMEGLVFYGGLLLGLLLALAVGRFRKQRFWETMDLAGLCVPLALGIGRIGCLLNGCCYGKVTSLPWGVTYPASTLIIGSRHPTQVYEMLLDFILFAIIWVKRDSFKREGSAFWVFVMGYSGIRFLVEFFRDHGNTKANLFFQLSSAALFVAAILVLLFRYRILQPAKSGEDLYC